MLQSPKDRHLKPRSNSSSSNSNGRLGTEHRVARHSRRRLRLLPLRLARPVPLQSPALLHPRLPPLRSFSRTRAPTRTRIRAVGAEVVEAMRLLEEEAVVAAAPLALPLSSNNSSNNNSSAQQPLRLTLLVQPPRC